MCETLQRHEDEYKIVGWIPSAHPVINGGESYFYEHFHAFDINRKLPAHDLLLSVQYDKKIDTERHKKSYNLHTGLLPEWGGSDILYHTIREGAREQGLTLHKMTERLDEGPIISKITYPVLPTDHIIDLYEKMYRIAGPFALSSFRLLKKLNESEQELCTICPPRFFLRGRGIQREDKEMYRDTLEHLRAIYEKD